jgi:uncharacterized membrane protein YccF (DUF307 family)
MIPLHQNCLSFLEKKGNSFDLIDIIYVIWVLLAGLAMNLSFSIVSSVIQGLSLVMFPLAFSITQIIFPIFPKEPLAISQAIIICFFPQDLYLD